MTGFSSLTRYVAWPLRLLLRPHIFLPSLSLSRLCQSKITQSLCCIHWKLEHICTRIILWKISKSGRVSTPRWTMAYQDLRSDKLPTLHLHPASLPISSTLMHLAAIMLLPRSKSVHLPLGLIVHTPVVTVAECEQPRRLRPRRLQSLRLRLRLLPTHCPFRNLSPQPLPISSHALAGMPLHVPQTPLHPPSLSARTAGRVLIAPTSSITAARPILSAISRLTRRMQISRCGCAAGYTRQTR